MVVGKGVGTAADKAVGALEDEVLVDDAQGDDAQGDEALAVDTRVVFQVVRVAVVVGVLAVVRVALAGGVQVGADLDRAAQLQDRDNEVVFRLKVELRVGSSRKLKSRKAEPQKFYETS